MCRGQLATVEERHAKTGVLHGGNQDMEELEEFLQAKIDARLEHHRASLEMSFGLQLQQHKRELHEALNKQLDEQTRALAEWQERALGEEHGRYQCLSACFMDLLKNIEGDMRRAITNAKENAREDLEEVDVALQRELAREQATVSKIENELCTLREALGLMSVFAREVHGSQEVLLSRVREEIQAAKIDISVAPPHHHGSAASESSPKTMVSPESDRAPSLAPEAFVFKAQPPSPANAVRCTPAAGSESQRCSTARVLTSATRPLSPLRPLASARAAGSHESLRTFPGSWPPLTSGCFPLGVRAARAAVPTVCGSFSPPALRPPKAIAVPAVSAKEAIGIQPVCGQPA